MVKPLINYFSVAIRLWVVGGGELELNANKLTELIPEGRGELQASVRDDRLRGPVHTPDVAIVQVCSFFCAHCLIAWQ